MVVSLDCCFSFPAWFLAEHECRTVFEFWQKVAEGQGERWLARECEEVKRDVRFWGNRTSDRRSSAARICIRLAAVDGHG